MENRPVPLTWFVDGAEPALIDAGYGTPAELVALRDKLRGRALSRVLVTHGHPDHASGVLALREAWPRVELMKHRLPGDHAHWTHLYDGQHVRAGDLDLMVLATPGHAEDHICFWEPDSGDLYSGDMLIEGASVMIPAGHGGDMRAYLASLAKLAALSPRRIYPGHGRVIDNPQAAIAEQIARRLDRESQILAIVTGGVVDPDHIVRRLYAHLPPDRLEAARLTVLAHLEKLRVERRIPG